MIGRQTPFHQCVYAGILYYLGGFRKVAPPVPIPNTEVKLLSADDTGGAALCGK
jgi:hypothetical protein